MPSRRQFLHHSLQAAVLGGCGAAWAQPAPAPFPRKPVTIVVGLAPGASTDTGARMLAQEMSLHSAHPFIVDNKVGAGSTIAAALVAQAVPDGHTLFLGTGSYATSAVLYKSLPFDPVKAFKPITQINRFPQAIAVSAKSDIQTLQDLVRKAKAAPGELAYGSTGHGGQTHLTGELFKIRAGVDMTHVPYRGAAPAILELLGGRLPVVFTDLFSLLPYARKGDVRILAVTSTGRAQIAPNIPTAAEQGVKDLDVTAWLGLFAPARTPDTVVDYVQKLVARATANPEFVAKMAQSGAEMVASTPTAFSDFFQRELALYRNVSAQGKITLE